MLITLSAHPSQCTSALAPLFFPVATKTESAETLAGPVDSGQLVLSFDFDGADLAEYHYENDRCVVVPCSDFLESCWAFVYEFGCLDATNFIPTGSVKNLSFGEYVVECSFSLRA